LFIDKYIVIRFERAPVVERAEWWKRMPVKRHHTFR
jgi:hypothetical protein